MGEHGPEVVRQRADLRVNRRAWRANQIGRRGTWIRNESSQRHPKANQVAAIRIKRPGQSTGLFADGVICNQSIPEVDGRKPRIRHTTTITAWCHAVGRSPDC